MHTQKPVNYPSDSRRVQPKVISNLFLHTQKTGKTGKSKILLVESLQNTGKTAPLTRVKRVNQPDPTSFPRGGTPQTPKGGRRGRSGCKRLMRASLDLCPPQSGRVEHAQQTDEGLSIPNEARMMRNYPLPVYPSISGGHRSSSCAGLRLPLCGTAPPPRGGLRAG